MVSWRVTLRNRYHAALFDLVHETWRVVQQAGMITAGSRAGRKFASFGSRSAS